MISMRTIVHDPGVSQEIDNVREQHPRIDEMIAGLEWRLCREPECGIHIPGTNPQRYLFKIAPPLKDQPDITTLYSFDEDEVNIIAIRISEQAE